MSQPCDLYSN